MSYIFTGKLTIINFRALLFIFFELFNETHLKKKVNFYMQNFRNAVFSNNYISSHICKSFNNIIITGFLSVKL